jgi:tetratricopeptide (TPR) repeat protein
MNLKKKCLLYFLIAVPIMAGVPALPASSPEEATVYFNAGTEKYLQGRFTESVEDLEKARQLDPGNAKIKDFMTRILLEAATQDHMNHNYRQAMVKLEKAKALSPDNAKVKEMYRLTGTLTGQSQEKGVFRKSLLDDREEKTSASILNGEKKRENLMPEKSGKPVRTERRAPVAVTTTERSVNAREQLSPRQEEKDRRTLITGISASLAMLCLLFCFILIAKLRRLSIRCKSAEEQLRTAETENNRLVIETEKMKERVKYEHQSAEELRRDLKERSRREEERLKAELELKTRQAEERVRSELLSRQPHTASSEEAFLHQQQAKFLEYVDHTAVIDGTLSPALEAARERISMMAENLYEYAPVAAKNFLNKMATNENALIRANVVRALARVACPETVGLLLRLFEDEDYRVKREALKNLKQLRQRLAANEISVPEELHARIEALLDNEKRRGEWIL